MFVIASSLKHFRCAVVRGAGKREHLAFDASFDKFSTNSEIDEDDSFVGLIIENIFRFDISMAYFLRMQKGKC